MKFLPQLFISFLVLMSLATSAAALTYDLPPPGENVVGHPQCVQTRIGDNFSILGRRYDVAYFHLIEANPGINPEKIPTGTVIVIPTQVVLPPVPRKGIVISLSELRLYYFSPNGRTVDIYPIGIGRQGWITPLGVTHVIEKTENPVWIVPDSIKKDRLKDGVKLPNSVPPGPENPLGAYRMRLAIRNQTFLIHGTNDFTGVGRRSSSGCVRMLPEDVESLFRRVSVGTEVNIISGAYKAGWQEGKLYLEAHIPLQEQKPNGEADLPAMKRVIEAAINSSAGTVYWQAAKRVAEQQNGVPQVIGTKRGQDS